MGRPKKRKVDLIVISDVHLGTRGSNAKELLQYMKSIAPKTVILNGDIIDIWQFKKRYFPKSHMQVIKQITAWMAKGVRVYYVTGNHDEMLRKFVGFKMGSLKIVNKVVLNLNGEKAWFFHGDVFDVTMKHSKWLTKLGSVGYDVLIIINRIVNQVSKRLGKGKISLSKRIKNSVKSAVKFINNFEQVAADIGIENGYEYVICGHIHQPEMKEFSNRQGKITYLNSGDWVENLSSLEYHKGKWRIYRYDPSHYSLELAFKSDTGTNKELFQQMVEEFKLLSKTVS
ncbi:MAG: UDP-2,3-diacylglucosamine diphosphatase [Vicingaceae bacterium]